MYIVTKEKVIHLPTQAVTDLDAMYQTRLAQERKVVSEVEKMITELDMMKYIDSGPEKPPEQPKSS